MEILPVENEDLSDIKELRPEGWGDILSIHQFYVENEFCYPFKFISENKIIGIGTAILNKGTAWLAHIIVDKEHRKRGIGYCITDHLIKFAEGEGCKSISLIATELGKPVYQKLGFEIEEIYSVFKGPGLECQNNFNIRPFLKSKHLDEILTLDQEITGEDRRLMIEARLKNAVVYVSNKKIIGYHLPQMGEGPVYAITAEAGLELIKYRCTEEENLVVLPHNNTPAVKFLSENNYKEHSSCARMIRGERLLWKPECIFARVGGFFG